MSSSIDNLFGSVENVDSNIDKLFSASTGPVNSAEIIFKKRTIVPAANQANEKPIEVVKEAGTIREQEPIRLEKEEKVSSDSSEEEVEEPSAAKKKRSRVEDDEDAELEQRYYSKLMGETEKTGETQNADSNNTEGTSQDNSKKASKIDLKEDELEKAERTIFVGNLSNDVITSKPTYKKFKKLFSTIPNQNKNEGEESEEIVFAISSIRFRSISFDEALPRKVAFAQNKLHQSRDSVNAYIVFKDRSAVRKVCTILNGHEFMSRHLRVDSVSHPAPHENKRSIFVGNLDFEEDEESLWSHFKSCGDIEYVRIVRDPKTNVGKGFAYVQFQDFQSVNKALLLNDKPMASLKSNGKKRKLRVSRCKNIMKRVKSGSKSRAIDSKLHENQKTKIGRARKILGKADKATAGQNITIEGLRATKLDGSTNSILKRKKQRSKTGRVTKRSQAFKKTQSASK